MCPSSIFALVVLGIILVYLLFYSKKEGYKNLPVSGYERMSQLPFALPPVGRGSLGYAQHQYLLKIHPGNIVEREVPVSCPLPSNAYIPASCPNNGVRISQTGNSLNPNTYSYILDG